MRLIDIEPLIDDCDECISIEWNHKVSPSSWADAEEEFRQRLLDAPTIDPASLRAKGEWISVEDRLPKAWEDVLVLLQCGDCIVAARSGKYWRERWCHSMLDRPPTHWMPLPEPPNCGGSP